MSHKAGSEFFRQKRSWSKRKDLILGEYLAPYLPIVNTTLKRPVLVVDGFAGPGQFDDGEAGSPLIICSKVNDAISRGVNASVLCIEPREDLWARLVENLRPFPFAKACKATFLEQLPSIEDAAVTHTVFLYLDPFTVEGLEWREMDRLFRRLQTSRASVEVLLNFNVESFCRRGLSALALSQPSTETEEGDSLDLRDSPPVPIERLNAIVGGDWWIDALRQDSEFRSQVARVTNLYCAHLGSRFKEVCQHPVKAEAHHQIPRYVLVFGTRSTKALTLMNDAMVKSRELFAEATAPMNPTLFELRPADVVPDKSRLPSLLLDVAGQRMSRGDLIICTIRRAFCDFSETEIRQSITALIRDGRLQSATGKSRINDDVEVWRTTN